MFRLPYQRLPCIGQNNVGFVSFDTTQVGLPFGTLQLTPDQVSFLTNPATLASESKLGGSGFASRFFSHWTFAPIVEAASGRPFNIITSNDQNLQLSSLTGRPNTFVNPNCGLAVKSKDSPTGVLQAPCVVEFNGTLLSRDGDLSRNAGMSPWTVFNDVRVSRRIYLTERFSVDAMADAFNLVNKYNGASVNPLWTVAGQATSAYDPRQFQLALKLNW